MGLGISGRAAVQYALRRGAEVAVSDIRTREQLLGEEQDLLGPGNIEFEAGGHSLEFLEKRDLILISPGIDNDLPLLQQLRSVGIPVYGELAVAGGEFAVPVVAITGTNGKTTVTTLIGQILTEAGKRVFVGGNIGTPLYEYLDNPDAYDVVVVEVSSFQLESAGDFAPTVGLLLNISPDHLDRHHTLEQYLQVKMRLFANQQKEHCAIVFGDDPLCRLLPPDSDGAVYTFGLGDENNAHVSRQSITLTIDNEKKEYSLEGTGQSGVIAGLNCSAAILAATLLGCDDSAIRSGLINFRPLAHRIEFVTDVGGVSYYNDSKATNTGAVIAALEQFDRRVILIAGGRDKGDDFRLLRKSVLERVDKVITLGEAASLIEDALGDLVPIVRADSMEMAVRCGHDMAGIGNVVLLSPGCASFDMFQSYGQRGDVFKQEVLAIGARNSS
ncbi:MAG: UDP-N-acetylmuramoyl-L-alanine--D-glutamate ligase [Desulforhopalus sp.]